MDTAEAVTYEQLDDNDVNKNMQKLFNFVQDQGRISAARHSEFISKFDDLNKKYDELKAENVQLARNYYEIYDELMELKAGLGEVQQKELASNIIIRGVVEAEKTTAELQLIVNNIFTLLNLNFDAPAIVTVKRIGKPSENSKQKSKRPIIIQFADKQFKDMVLAAKKAKKLNCSQLKHNNNKLGTEKDIIYIEEQLTKQKQKLFAEARQLKKAGAVQFAWTNGGRILVREKEKDPALRLDHEGHLQNLRRSLNILDKDLATTRGAQNGGRSGRKRATSPNAIGRNLRPRIVAETANT